jgi:hypothetical protein
MLDQDGAGSTKADNGHAESAGASCPRSPNRRACRSWSASEAVDRAGSGAGAAGTSAQAVSICATFSSRSSAMEISRILNFCTLPVTVIGKPSTNLQ